MASSFKFLSVSPALAPGIQTFLVPDVSKSTFLRTESRASNFSPLIFALQNRENYFVGGALRLLFQATIPFYSHPLSQISQLLGLSDNMIILFLLHSSDLFHYPFLMLPPDLSQMCVCVCPYYYKLNIILLLLAVVIIIILK